MASSLAAQALRLRRIAPPSIKYTARLLRYIFAPPSVGSLSLDQDLVRECRVVACRETLLSKLPTSGVVGEIGVWKGEFSKKILEITQPKELHLFDMDFSICKDEIKDTPNVFMHEGNSSDSLLDLPPATFDWLYVDGDHSYEGVLADIDAAVPLLKPSGFLVFNDYAHISPNSLGTFGVHRAVTEFVCRERWPLVYLAWQTNGLYDVAIQRPDVQ